MRLTDKKIVAKLKDKKSYTDEEKIYLKLAGYENAEEKRDLFSKSQVNVVIAKCARELGEVVKNQITKEILLALIAEAKKLSKDGKVLLKEVEDIASEIIKKVAETK